MSSIPSKFQVAVTVPEEFYPKYKNGIAHYSIPMEITKKDEKEADQKIKAIWDVAVNLEETMGCRDEGIDLDFIAVSIKDHVPSFLKTHVESLDQKDLETSLSSKQIRFKNVSHIDIIATCVLQK